MILHTRSALRKFLASLVLMVVAGLVIWLLK